MMERRDNTGDHSMAYQESETNATILLTQFLKNWFPPELGVVLEQSVTKIEALESVKLAPKQLAYFGPRDRGIHAPEDGQPKYVRIVQNENVEWYTVGFQVINPNKIRFYPKEPVPDFTELQKNIPRFEVLLLILDYCGNKDSDQAFQRINLKIERMHMDLATNQYNTLIGTYGLTDAAMKGRLAQVMESFINNKEYLFLKPTNQIIVEKPDPLSTRESKEENTKIAQAHMETVSAAARQAADMAEIDRIDESQYRAMQEEERNRVLAEIERREATDQSYQKPSWISQDERATYFGGEYGQTISRGDIYLNEESFQNDIKRNFPTPPR